MAKDSLILKAIRKEKVERIPVWMMRQAGRYLPQYREVRKSSDFLTMCRTPELAVEISMQPIDLVGVDAGIIFSDILIPVEAMGVGVEFIDGKGPVLKNPVKNRTDIDNLKVASPKEDMPFVADSIRLFRKQLPSHLPVLGFVGAPWTMASYMIEGMGSKNYAKIKTMMYQDKKSFFELMEKITETVSRHLLAQIDAGADVVQIFDTWAGILSPSDFDEYAFPFIKKIVDNLRKETDTPITLYVRGSGNILEKMVETGVDTISIDWMLDLAEAKKRIGDKVALQGNLDPCMLYGPKEFVKAKTLETLNKFGKETGFIFNLGHGILPTVPVENVKEMINTVKNF